jgi:hypothetical protein
MCRNGLYALARVPENPLSRFAPGNLHRKEIDNPGRQFRRPAAPGLCTRQNKKDWGFAEFFPRVWSYPRPMEQKSQKESRDG